MNNMLYRGNPCKECGDRHPGCHGGCEKYKAWREEVDRKKNHIYESRKGAELATSFTLDQIYKQQKESIKRKKRGFN